MGPQEGEGHGQRRLRTTGPEYSVSLSYMYNVRICACVYKYKCLQMILCTHCTGTTAVQDMLRGASRRQLKQSSVICVNDIMAQTMAGLYT